MSGRCHAAIHRKADTPERVSTVLEATREELEAIRRSIEVSQADLTEVMLSKLAGQPLESDERARRELGPFGLHELVELRPKFLT